MAEDKNITLHPTSETGAIDPEINLYPKTKPGNILGLDDYLKEYIREAFFPIGSIYVSSSSTFNPELKFGGKWRAIEGKFLAGIGQSTDAEGHSYSIASGTGGFADAVLINHTHTTETSEAGSHTHTFTGTAVNTGNNNIGHTHSLNGHTHTFSGTTDANGNHTHESTYSITMNVSKGYAGLSTVGAGSTDDIVKFSNFAGSSGDKSKELSQTVTSNEDGSHTHAFSGTTGGSSQSTGAASNAHTHSVTAAGTISSNGSHTHTITMQNPDNGINSGEDRNIPPYQGVYIWERYE